VPPAKRLQIDDLEPFPQLQLRPVKLLCSAPALTIRTANVAFVKLGENGATTCGPVPL
jgi:hypothetical protein